MDESSWIETERANLLHDICAALGAVCAPAMAPPPTMPPNPTRFRIRYGVAFCTLCNLAAAFCRCAERLPDSPSNDARAESDLVRRIREAQQ